MGLHDHGSAAVEPRTARLLAVVAGGLALVTLVAILVLRDAPPAVSDLGQLGIPDQLYAAEVEDRIEAPCAFRVPDPEIRCVTLELRLTDGPDEGRLVVLEQTTAPSEPDLQVGDEAILGHAPDAEPGFDYFFVDRQRRQPLLILGLVFGVAVVVLGRLRGLAALIGLGASLVVLIEFVIPTILSGTAPLAVAVVGAAAIAFLALYLTHGFRPMTTVALLGTLGALALTAVLASLFTALTEISGFASEESLVLQIAAAQVDLQGLILGGIVIGALGAIDDVTVTQASAIWEIRAANPSLGFPELWGRGLRIGRDHVASTVNTLVLAYAGASLPLLILFSLSDQSLGAIANSEIVATEIVRGLVGSVGLVAAVPITTALAAAVAARSVGPAEPAPEGHND